MKTMLLFRHSKKEKEGPLKDTLGTVGIKLAEDQGFSVFRRREGGEGIDKIFHTVLLRSAQTAMAFMVAWNPPYQLMPVVQGLGSNEEFVPVCPADVMALYDGGMPHFQAMQECFSDDVMKGWASKGLDVMNGIFGQMEEGETALVIGHSPFVEFAVWGCVGRLPDACLNLPEMAGFKLINKEGSITLGAIYTVPG